MTRVIALTAGVAAAVFAHRVGYWDGWHKGVAHGRQLGRDEARRDYEDPTFPQCLTTEGPPFYDMARSVFAGGEG